MQFTNAITLLTTLFVAASHALPTAADSSNSNSNLESRQEYYDGPCNNEVCGADRINCRAQSMWCVAYPSISEPEGCTCSHM